MIPMYIMPSRYEQLVDAVQGYQQTGVPLVAAQGARLYPAGYADDAGIYYFIPKLVSWLGITAKQAVDLFFAGTAALAIIAALMGFFMLYRQWNQRIFALLVLSGSSYMALRNGDVYIISFFVVVAVVPWVLLAARSHEGSVSVYLIFPAVSFLVSIAHIVRSHSGTGILVFTGVLFLFFMKIRDKTKAVLLLLMILTALVPILFFSHVVSERNEYLIRLDPSVDIADGMHPFWHSVYIGLGFIDNPYVDKYLDEVAMGKVKSRDPNARFISPEYANILRHETIMIIRENPKFILMNIAAKGGVIFLYFIIFANIGLVAAYLFRKPFPMDLAFLLGMFFNSLFGIAVVPYTNYLLGFVAFASLYCIVSVTYALDKRTIGELASNFLHKQA